MGAPPRMLVALLALAACAPAARAEPALTPAEDYSDYSYVRVDPPPAPPGPAALPPCGLGDESRALSGTWRVEGEAVSGKQLPEHTCASTAAQHPERLCSGAAGARGGPYKRAHFAPSECTTPPLADTLRALAPLCGGRRLAFVGDSLNKQNEVAVRCAAEQLAAGAAPGDGPSLAIRDYVTNEYLADNRPCHSNCTDDAFFEREAGVRTRQSQCSRCDADRHPPILVKPQWLADVEAEVNATCALVLGTGAWYTPTKGVPCPEATLQDTLTLLKPLLRNVSAAGVPVLWLGLPPCTRECEPDSGKAWGSFARYDELAARALGGRGGVATFFNVSRATRQRKEEDPAVSMDGLHWCGPGPFSVPRFLMQVVLHALVLQLDARAQQQSPSSR